MRAIEVGYYGDQTRWFIGVVKNIDDPRSMGRVKVRIYGVHNHDTSIISDNDLPWAQVIAPITQPGVPGKLSATGVQVGAQVYGIFLDGQASQQPLVIGVLASMSKPVIGFPGFNSSLYTSVNGRSITAQRNDGNTNAGGAFPANITLSEGSNAEIAFDFIHAYFAGRAAPNPSIAAAAFVGNFINESGSSLNPRILGDNGNALGIAQWNGPRMRNLLAFLLNNNINTDAATDLQMLEGQLQFWAYEMEGAYNYVFSAVKSAPTIGRATQIVLNKYENPLVVINFQRSINGQLPAYGSQEYQQLVTAGNSNTLAYNRELLERISAAMAVEDAFASTTLRSGTAQ